MDTHKNGPLPANGYGRKLGRPRHPPAIDAVSNGLNAPREPAWSSPAPASSPSVSGLRVARASRGHGGSRRSAPLFSLALSRPARRRWRVTDALDAAPRAQLSRRPDRSGPGARRRGAKPEPNASWRWRSDGPEGAMPSACAPATARSFQCPISAPRTAPTRLSRSADRSAPTRTSPSIRFHLAASSKRRCPRPVSRTPVCRMRASSSKLSTQAAPVALRDRAGPRRSPAPRRNTGAIPTTSWFPSRTPSGCRGPLRARRRNRPQPIPLNRATRLRSRSTSTASTRRSARRPQRSAARRRASATRMPNAP